MRAVLLFALASTSTGLQHANSFQRARPRAAATNYGRGRPLSVATEPQLAAAAEDAGPPTSAELRERYKDAPQTLGDDMCLVPGEERC